MEDDAAAAGSGLREQAADWLISLDCGTADEQAFERWRSADPRHAAAFAQVAATWRRTADPRLATLTGQPEDPAPAAEPDPQPVAPRAVSRRALAGGAVAAMLGVGAAGTFLVWPRRSYAATAVGERRTIQLPDGSHAMLNTDTRLAWRFDEGREFWIERGEASLIVRPGVRPFRVYSDPFDARLSEGRFDIRLDAEDGRLLVLAGRAAAAYRGTMAQTVEAGRMLTVTNGTGQVTALPAGDIAAATAWQGGRIVFDGMSLGHAVSEFNRYLPHKITLRDSGLADIPLGGEFRIADPDGFLFALREGFGIDHQRQGDRIMLYRKR